MYISLCVSMLICTYVSVNSKPDHPPRATSGDSPILVAPGVFAPLFCPGGCPGGLKSK